jgi:hypothetical protein
MFPNFLYFWSSFLFVSLFDQIVSGFYRDFPECLVISLDFYVIIFQNATNRNLVYYMHHYLKRMNWFFVLPNYCLCVCVILQFNY